MMILATVVIVLVRDWRGPSMHGDWCWQGSYLLVLPETLLLATKSKQPPRELKLTRVFLPFSFSFAFEKKGFVVMVKATGGGVVMGCCNGLVSSLKH